MPNFRWRANSRLRNSLDGLSWVLCGKSQDACGHLLDLRANSVLDCGGSLPRSWKAS